MSGLQESQQSMFAQNAIALIGIETESREIPLTRGLVAIVDVEDYPRVSQYKWSASKSKNTFYAIRNIPDNGWTSLSMHRFILGLGYGDKRITDHINRNGLDNRRSNLRIADSFLNAYNCKMQSSNTSGYRGVCWHNKTKRWWAYFKFERKIISCGYHKTPEDAAVAHDIKSREYWGRNAMVNFTEDQK
jgi:hypothetical protein